MDIGNNSHKMTSQEILFDLPMKTHLTPSGRPSYRHITVKTK